MRALTAPGTLPANNRVQPTEATVFTINATLTEYKLESDSDYHIVIQDASGNTMITEIPSPGCVGTGSPFATMISSARSKFDAQLHATTSFQTANIPVQIKGVGFFDFLHGQTGVAPNGVELHPVLDIVFNPGNPTPDFTISAPSNLAVTAGSAVSGTVTTTVSGGFNSAVSLTAGGLPTGATSSFSPASIAAPGAGSSTLTINAGSTTAAGNDTVSVTGTGGGKTHSTNIALAVSAAGGGTTDIMMDGGFEQATSTGNTAPGWTATSTNSTFKVIQKAGSFPNTGSNYAQMGGNNSQTDTLTQTVTIASNATAASLSFWANIVTTETGTTAFDKLTVEIHNSSGTLLATPLTLSNVDATKDNNTAGSYFQPAAINLLSYAGQTIQIVFKSVNGSVSPTTFRIDDVSLPMTTPGSGSDTTPPTASITAPANGATVSNSVTIAATASDNVGVVKMELYIDGTLTTSNTNATSLSFSWNTNPVSNGSHALVVKAYDAANNVGTSATVTVTVSNTAASQLLGNPGFENGSTNPAPWSATSGVIDNSTGEAAHSGSWKAWMDGYGATHTDTLSQTVTLPSTLTSASLTFWLHIDTAETTTTTAFDTLKVQITNTSGTVLATLATYSNLNHNTGYTQKSFDVSAYKGQTIRILLTGSEDSSLQTSFVVDDFALTVQ
jgi:Bacterial Ig domain